MANLNKVVKNFFSKMSGREKKKPISKKEIITDEIKRQFRDSFSYTAVIEFYKFIEELGTDIIIVKMDCKLNSFDSGSYIRAKLARPIINMEDDCVEDYNHGHFLMVWDIEGKIIKRKTSIPASYE